MDVINIPSTQGSKHNIPKMIVIHTISEFLSYEGEDMYAPYFLRRIGLSAHRLVTPTGDMIKCREDEQGGYHAKKFNTDSLGIEFLMQGLHTYEEFIERMKIPYLTEIQVENGAYVIASWAKKWRIPFEMIKTHRQIDPKRKFDPGIEETRILEAVRVLL